MTDELTKAATAVATAIAADVYRDVAQPSLRRVGGALEVMTKVALTPISIVDWGYQQSSAWLKAKIEERLASTPKENVVEPPGNILQPILLRIAMSYDTEQLRDLYAELLMKAMDDRTMDQVHPAYVYLLEQLASEEALVLIGLHKRADSTLFTEKLSQYGRSGPSIEKQFKDYCVEVGLAKTDSSNLWLENLRRLRLVELSQYMDPEIRMNERSRYGEGPPSLETNETRFLEFTALGNGFVKACAPSQ